MVYYYYFTLCAKHVAVVVVIGILILKYDRKTMAAGRKLLKSSFWRHRTKRKWSEEAHNKTNHTPEELYLNCTV